MKQASADIPRSPTLVSARVRRYAEADIPTEHGTARILVFREHVGPGEKVEPREHVALVYGKPDPSGVVPVRVHSECITSEVFGSTKCDCKAQLLLSMATLVESRGGVLVYLRQEGRGIGLGNKIRAYALQDHGADTVEANHQLGFEADLRRYDVAAGMLLDLGIERVALLTNNPNKVSGLKSSGIEVVERIPLEVPATVYSAEYLRAKRDQLGHLLGALSS